MLRTTATATFLLMSTAACSGIDLLESAALVGGGGVQTDSASYHVVTTDAAHEVTIGVTFRNGTFNEVRIASCQSAYPPIVEKLSDAGWQPVYSPPVLLCLGPPVRIAPGAEYSMTYHVIGMRLPNKAPRLEVDEIAGTYRLNWYALHTKSGSELPAGYRTSNSFELRE